MTIPKILACPICKKKNTWTELNSFRPFCSMRCKMIDLGNWADEKHRLPGERIDPSTDSDKHEE